MTCRITASTPHTSLTSVCMSPDNIFTAYIGSCNSKLIVMNNSTNKVTNIFPCVDKIDTIEWSSDSTMILCAMFSRSAIQVFSVNEKEWSCRIDEGMAGMINCKWCPDSAHILVESDFGIQISVWSLCEGIAFIFHYPKLSNYQKTLCSFSDCGSYMCIGHRIDLQDYIGLYATKPWTELTKFKCKSNELARLSFVPSSTYILAIDSPLFYRLTVYSPSGECISNFEPYQSALGIRTFAFLKYVAAVNITSCEGGDEAHNISILPEYTTRNMKLIAVGSFDGKVRVLSSRSWALAFVLPLLHTKELCNYAAVTCDIKTTVEIEEGKASENSTVFESDIWGSTIDFESSILNKSISFNSTVASGSKYIYKNLKVLPKLSSSEIKAVSGMPKSGVSCLAWAPNSTLLAAMEESHPRCLWIWSVIEAKLIALLVQSQHITSMAWRPSSARPVLAFCTGTERVYIWTSDGPSWINVPISGMGIFKVEWTDDGGRLLLISKSSLTHCFFDESEFYS